jgi:uncharacterized protein
MNPIDTQDEPPAQYVRGVEFFDRAEFFAAHEAWEDLWRQAAGAEKQFFQGLVQCAVALEHARRGNVRGALRLAERYPPKFAGLPPVFMGLDISAFLSQMTRAMGAIEAAGEGGIDPALLPRIKPASK